MGAARWILSLALAALAPGSHVNTVSYPVFTVYEREVQLSARVQLAYFTDQVDFGRPGEPASKEAPRVEEAAVRARQGALVDAMRRALSVEADGVALEPRFEDLLLHARADPGPPPTAWIDEAEFRFRFEAAAPIGRVAIRYELFAGHDPTHRGIAKIRRGTAERAFVFRRGVTFEASVDEIASSGARAAASFFWLGMDHILGGYDHLLFLAGLLLAATSLRSVFLLATAFTVGHSATLVAAALRWIALPPSVVEPAIAASIAYVGIENVARAGEGRRRWVVASLFGLVHGLGFAGFVDEVGLPAGSAALSLGAFNLGVEAGQATAVCLAFPLLSWARERAPEAYRRYAERAGSLAIAAAGTAILAARLLGGATGRA